MPGAEQLYLGLSFQEADAHLKQSQPFLSTSQMPQPQPYFVRAAPPQL